MREPFPLEASSERPSPRLRAAPVVMPTSKDFPSGVYLPFLYQSVMQHMRSSRSIRPMSLMLSQVARVRLVSSDHVPGAILYVP